jgi:hypothetical protein
MAAGLDGLAAVGGPNDLEVFIRNLANASPNVRRAAVEGVGAFGEREAKRSLILPLLLDGSPRVCSTAARVLVRAGAGPTDVEAAWNSSQPWSRRAAWRISRESGSWNRVEADLRALCDADPTFADLGRAGIRNWLTFDAASTWTPLDDTQRQRLRRLLCSQPMDEHQRQRVAFHAGIRPETTSTPDATPEPPPIPMALVGRVMQVPRRRR